MLSPERKTKILKLWEYKLFPIPDSSRLETLFDAPSRDSCDWMTVKYQSIQAHIEVENHLNELELVKPDGNIGSEIYFHASALFRATSRARREEIIW